MINIGHIHLDDLRPDLAGDIRNQLTGGLERMPIVSISGHYRSLDLIFFRRGQRTCVRPYKIPFDPKTDFQLTRRSVFRQANCLWSLASTEQREAWQRYALKHKLLTGGNKGGGNPNQAGQLVFADAQSKWLALGLGPHFDAPVHAPPSLPRQITQEAAYGPDVLAFRLEHNVKDTSGWRVLVEMTPATLRATRKPRENDLAWARGVAPGSFLELKQSGQAYVLEDARYCLEADQRYGLRVCLINPGGVAGPRLCGDFIRLPEIEPPPAANNDEPFAETAQRASLAELLQSQPAKKWSFSAVQGAKGTLQLEDSSTRMHARTDAAMPISSRNHTFPRDHDRASP